MMAVSFGSSQSLEAVQSLQTDKTLDSGIHETATYQWIFNGNLLQHSLEPPLAKAKDNQR